MNEENRVIEEEFDKTDAQMMEQFVGMGTGKSYIPIWVKSNMTIEEASLYSGIGRAKIRELVAEEGCVFALHVGRKTLIKRRKFDEFIEESYAI